MTEPKGAKQRYKTTNRATYNAALKARGALTIWLDKNIQWYALANRKRGRQRTFSEAVIQFCLSIKCLFGLATGALNLLADSTGVKFLDEGEWRRKKHAAQDRHQWHKMHLGIDANTLAIWAIEVTDNSVGDAPMLPELLGQKPCNEPIASVSADGACDAKVCHGAIPERGAQAMIPPRKNARLWRATLKGALAPNEALKGCRWPGWRIWKKCSGYHRRSLVETEMHCFKRLDEWVMARTFER